MIAIVDYDTGNLRSVCNAVARLGASYCVTSDVAALRQADKVILPGVGEASSAMDKLRERGLTELIPTLQQPVLGICIGMQLMCRSSEEGNTTCLGIFNTPVRRLLPDAAHGIKVPHMGWNSIEHLRTPLFAHLEAGAYVYYVHSFAPAVCDETIAISTHGVSFSAALARENFYGTQFHPEKSGDVGECILRNFLNL